MNRLLLILVGGLTVSVGLFATTEYQIAGNEVKFSVGDTGLGYSSVYTTPGLTVDVTTPGPVRSGYVEFTNLTLVGSDVTGFTLIMSNGNVSRMNDVDGCYYLDRECNEDEAGSAFEPGNVFGFGGTRPITLGELFEFDAGVSFYSFPVADSTNDTFVGSFQFFESDGTTPVDIANVAPEPFSANLCVIGSIAVSMLAKGRLMRAR